MRRMLLAGVLAPALFVAVAPVSTISQVLGWTPWGFALPSGAVLRQALHACQFVRNNGRQFTLCPQRLAYTAFPKVLVDALVASEDRSFYDHRGIDKRAILHAAITDVIRSIRDRRLRFPRGGSTITQQLARTLFLDERQGLDRKLEEAALAPRIETMLSKRQILAAYMNVVPHARGMNGFDAAARHFFGVPVGEIDLSEAALLVGMLPAPNNRDPTRHPQAALDAAARVLDRMREQTMIGAAAQARAERELAERIGSGDLRRGRIAQGHEEMRPYRDLALAQAAAHGAVDGSDYRLIVHVDPMLQSRVVQATRRMAGRYQAAGVFIRPTGEVLAISGSRDYLESSYNRAFQARRPIGSTGKLFVLIAAEENGIPPDKTFPEGPIRPGWPAEPDRRCRDPMTLAAALAWSCNRPYAWAASELGWRLTATVERFDLKPPDAPVLVPLGGIATTPLRLARAYAAVINDGALPRVHALAASLSHAGSVLYAPAPYAEPVMSPEVAHSVLAALRRPVTDGTARRAASPYATVYGKTGTTNSDRDALFVGMTKDFVGALWIGADDNRRMQGVSSSGGPAVTFASIADGYYRAPSRPPIGTPRGPTAGWGWMSDLMPDRDHRYYALVGFGALITATYWLRLRNTLLGRLVRSRFGMAPLAAMLIGAWRLLAGRPSPGRKPPARRKTVSPRPPPARPPPRPPYRPSPSV